MIATCKFTDAAPVKVEKFAVFVACFNINLMNVFLNCVLIRDDFAETFLFLKLGNFLKLLSCDPFFYVAFIVTE